MENIKEKLNSGFIALVSLLVISAVALSVSVSISILGVTEARNSLDYKKGQEVLKIAEGCTEEAMIRLKQDINYTGTGPSSLTLGDGECDILVSGVAENKTISITARIVGNVVYTKKIQVEARVRGNSINLLSWQEIE